MLHYLYFKGFTHYLGRMSQMGDLDSVINNSKLPDQLKEYFKKSVRIKKILKVDTINDIEDIYIFYDSLYTFDSSEFSSCVVISLSKCTNFDTFYHYLKKVIDTSSPCVRIVVV